MLAGGGAEGEEEKHSQVDSMLRAEPRGGAGSQDPEILTSAEIKINQLHHRGTPACFQFYWH